MDQIRTLVVLAESAPGTWKCELGPGAYWVSRREQGQFEVEVCSRRVVIDSELGTLDAACLVIGSHARLVSSALAIAAAIQLRHGAPAAVVPLE
ncbi:hypothetical protein AB0451_35555 [Streptomyces sp. NPDC052000]|uniref:hypothetical protein n=1 Tax=Streptomyces sp. NPDC052000 TaxID=3155676 RepID=UPI00344DADCC